MKALRRSLRVGLLTAGAISCLAGSASAITSADIIAKFNAERQAFGLSTVTERADWDQACLQHDQYMAQNNTLTHFESNTAPGYTTQGDWAGRHSVLSQGSSWDNGDPWASAPFHYAQMMNPDLTTSAAAEAQGYNCLVTLGEGGSTPLTPATDTLYGVVPGPNNWSENVQGEFNAQGQPDAPGDHVGLPQGTTTGPDIMVYWRGPATDNQTTFPLSVLQAATITAPDGSTVDSRIVSNNNSSGFVIPVQPLQPNTAYTVSATFSTAANVPAASQRQWTGTFTFTTKPIPPADQLVKLSFRTPQPDPNLVWVDYQADPVMSGQPDHIKVTDGAGNVVQEFDGGLGTGGGFAFGAQPAPFTVTLSWNSFMVGPVTIPAGSVNLQMQPTLGGLPGHHKGKHHKKTKHHKGKHHKGKHHKTKPRKPKHHKLPVVMPPPSPPPKSE